MSDLTVVTYGGGEVLHNVFNAIAMLFNGGKGDLIRPLALIAASIGGIHALSTVLFSGSIEALISKYLIPLIAIPSLLMVPTSTIHIEDILKHKGYKVDHVPFFLAKFTETISSIGYHITTGIEKVMHVPNDVSYNKTGMIFGADTALDMSRYRITNANLEQNLRKFAKQCVFYDTGIGRYSLDDIRKSTDLWKFLKSRTSKVQMIPYLDPGSASSKNWEYLSCRDALIKMTPYFEKEKKFYAQEEILQNLPYSFQALTGLQREKKELVGQQLMMNLLSDENGGKVFARLRAKEQQKSTYLVLGALASSSLVTMRAVLEVLIYASFVLILPMTLLPGGVRFISTWIWLAVWIQLWPPFYAILNYVMHSVADKRAHAIFAAAGDHMGLSLFTSAGVQNLNEDIYALSGYLAASIPFISYALMRGGVQSFIHMAGSMMTPAHSAATTASAEQTAGNYSFANASMGQMSYENETLYQKNLAPSISLGHTRENTGDSLITHAASGTYVQESKSNFAHNVFADESLSQSMQTAHMQAQSAVETTQKSYTESVSGHARSFTDMTEHLSNGENYTQGVSQREAIDIQETARSMQSSAESWGQQFGLNSRDSMSILVAANAGVSLPMTGITLGIEGKGSSDHTLSEDEVFNSARNFVESEEFSSGMQKIQGFAETSNFSSLNDQGLRISEGYTNSLDQVHSSQEQHQAALSKMEQTSQNLSFAESLSHSIKKSLDQPLLEFAANKYQGEGGFDKALDVLTHNDSLEKSELIHEFLYDYSQKHDSFGNDTFSNPEDTYNSSFIPQVDALQETEDLQAIYSQSKERTTSFSQAKSHLEDLKSNHSNQFDDHLQVASRNAQSTKSAMQQNLQNTYEERLNNPLDVLRIAGIKSSDPTVSGRMKSTTQPLWHENKESND